MADITLINLNMLFIRHGEGTEKELHVPLGPLYLTRAIENAGFKVDFRDYQLCKYIDPFDMNRFLEFLNDPAPVIGLSCMANLLPFSILALKALRERYPDRKLVLGGVGASSVEEKILTRFPWIDVICCGEGEQTGPLLLDALINNNSLSTVNGIAFRNNSTINFTPKRSYIQNINNIPFPAFEKIKLKQYAGYGLMTSRGCPYLCTFCSVAPIWNQVSNSRSPKNIVEEMELLNKEAGVDMFLFQDEFFVSGKKHVLDFCKELRLSKLNVEWKAFGRVNLVDGEMMRAMADCGCLELRFGIESGSDKILKKIKKGFNTAQVHECIPQAIEIFPRVDTFYIWGFPFETMEDFNQSLFQMISFRMMGARILPSLLSLLPQTEIYRELANQIELEFCPYLLPEFVFTGHEIYHGGEVEIPEFHSDYFKLIKENPDIFPGFFHINLEDNILPKLKLLRQFGFYPDPKPVNTKTESCGAHSPNVALNELATSYRTRDNK